MPLYPCAICGKMIEKPHAWRKRSKLIFCSDECRNTPFVEKTCQVCGKTFHVTYHCAHGAAYCSNDCHHAEQREKHAAGKYPTVTRVCKACGKSFEVRRSYADKQMFCSRQCWKNTIYRPKGQSSPKFKGKVTIICAYCGKPFETFPSRANRAKYCCRNHASLANAKRFSGEHRTNLEIAMADALRSAHLQFSEQVPMCDRWIVDFVLAQYPIVIQCDGVYWHDRPKAKSRDRGQDSYLANAGYIVLRFTDKQILHHIAACVRTIKRTIANHQLPLIPY